MCHKASYKVIMNDKWVPTLKEACRKALSSGSLGNNEETHSIISLINCGSEQVPKP